MIVTMRIGVLSCYSAAVIFLVALNGQYGQAHGNHPSRNATIVSSHGGVGGLRGRAANTNLEHEHQHQEEEEDSEDARVDEPNSLLQHLVKDISGFMGIGSVMDHGHEEPTSMALHQEDQDTLNHEATEATHPPSSSSSTFWENRTKTVGTSRKRQLGDTTNGDFLIGVGKNEITDGAINLGLQGWADSDQKTNTHPHERIYARAYLIQEEDADGGSLVAMVSTDNWAATDRIKRLVLERIGNEINGKRLDHDNFMLMASHQHSAPGGYSDYKLYEHTPGG